MSPDDILAAIPHASEEVIPVLLTEYDRAVLRDQIKSCTSCPLSESTTPVPWSGGRSPITLVGEAPGAQEETMGEPFVGASGNLLNSMLRSAGLSRPGVSLVNTICCRPPNNDFAKAREMDAPFQCDANFTDQLDFTESWLLVAMGANALSKFKPEHKGITRERGKAFWWQARLVVPTFHPAYALRTKEAEGVIIDDLRLAHRYLTGREDPPTCDQFDPSVIRGYRGPTDEAIVSHFDKYGWAVVYSPFLNARVAVTRGPSVPDFGHAYTLTPEYVAKMRGSTPNMWSAAAALFRELGAVPV